MRRRCWSRPRRRSPRRAREWRGRRRCCRAPRYLARVGAIICGCSWCRLPGDRVRDRQRVRARAPAARDPRCARLARPRSRAGAVFLGSWSPESMGDYCSGPNHTLPTYGYAKAYSGLSLEDFQKRITVQELTPAGFAAGWDPRRRCLAPRRPGRACGGREHSPRRTREEARMNPLLALARPRSLRSNPIRMPAWLPTLTRCMPTRRRGGPPATPPAAGSIAIPNRSRKR
jgi:hypothetical protein